MNDLLAIAEEALKRIADYDDNPDVIAPATLTRIAADALYEIQKQRGDSA